MKQEHLLVKYKKIVNITGLVLFVLITLSFVRNINKMVQIQKQVGKKEKKLIELKEANERIKNRLKEVEGGVFAEKQLRDNLGLAKEGEIIVVLPEEEVLKSLSPTIPREEVVLPEPNWQKWLKLFMQ